MTLNQILPLNPPPPTKNQLFFSLKLKLYKFVSTYLVKKFLLKMFLTHICSQVVLDFARVRTRVYHMIRTVHNVPPLHFFNPFAPL